ncbi:AAA family ATPase [Streptomyces sp. NPDC060194]|uniref:AAA family ATPase n=1 Tax=Streptomyces sp. NPDC060194 TaxID=3347069 RepID=UPI00365182E7
MRREPECVLVTGMPGAGKSTVTRLVGERFERAARLGGDDVNGMIVSGFVWALGEPRDEAARQVRLLHRNLCALANNFGDAGFTVLVDAVLPSRADLDFFLAELRSHHVQLVVLDPGIATCRYRNTVRAPSERFDFDGYDMLDASMRSQYGDVGWWFDTSALTPGQTADRIVHEGRRRARVR